MSTYSDLVCNPPHWSAAPCFINRRILKQWGLIYLRTHKISQTTIRFWEELCASFISLKLIDVNFVSKIQWLQPRKQYEIQVNNLKYLTERHLRHFRCRLKNRHIGRHRRRFKYLKYRRKLARLGVMEIYTYKLCKDQTNARYPLK